MEFRSKTRSKTKDAAPAGDASVGAASPRKRKAEKVVSRAVIGWREWVQLPSLLELPIKAKIDTGARTSAIHAFNISRIEVDGMPWVEFGVHPVQRLRHPEVRCRAPLLDQRMITSSNGHKQLRYIIKTMASIGEVHWPIELSLADRDQLGFRMLLGREAIRRRFVIDPSRSFRLSGRQPTTTTSQDHSTLVSHPKNKEPDQ